MNHIVLFFRKDLRLMRWPILLLATEALGVMLWYSMLPIEKRVAQIAVLPFWRFVIWAACFLIIGGLTQRDAPLREGAFFRTKPVALSTVLRSKCLMALFIVVLFAAIETVSLLMLGLKPGVLDFLLIFIEELLVLSALGAVSMALAMREQTAGKYFSSVAGWGGILLVGWIAFSWFKSSYFRNEKPDWSYDLEYLKLSRLLTAQFVLMAGAIIGILLFSHSRRRESISRSLALTTVCAIATLFCWPVNFVKIFAPALREAPKNEWPDQTKLKFAFEEQTSGRDEKKSIFAFNGDSGYNDVSYRKIQANARLTGLTGGWQPGYDNSYQSVLTLSNGTVFSGNHQAWGSLGWQDLLRRLGIPCPGYTDPAKQFHQFALSEFKLEDAGGAMTGAKLKGTMQIPLKRAVVLSRLPFRKGASTRIGQQLIEISRIDCLGDRINYVVATQSALIQLRGGNFVNNLNRLEFLVVNAGRGEFLFKGSQSGRSGPAGHYSLETLTFSESIWNKGYKEMPIPPDWTAGAELLVIGDENGGSFSQDFNFVNINLSNER